MKRSSVNRVAVSGALAAAVVLGVVLPSGTAEADTLPSNCTQSGNTVTCSFAYTGAQATFTVPDGISSLTISATGASGGGYGSPGSEGSAGGLGGVATDTYAVGADSTSGQPVFAGQTLYVLVGGAGSGPGSHPNGTPTPGGFNGGGTSADYNGHNFSFGAGGGASDVRTSTSPLSSDDSRLVVGGGGGGMGSCSSSSGSYGGNAGQAGGVGCSGVAGGGGSTSGGTASPPATPGSIGQGGNAAVGGAGGGGGGYFGGGGGLGSNTYIGPGGGGGSSWTSLHGISTLLASGGGNGSVVISYSLPVPQSITFGAVPSTVQAGLSSTLSATGGGSGQPVVISRDASSSDGACTVTSTGDGTASVTYPHPGVCVLDANQAGAGKYDAASQAQQSVQVVGRPSTVTVSTPPTAVVGQPVTATAHVAVFDGTAPVGAVQFSVAGTPVGSPVALDASGDAVSPNLALVGGGQLDPGSYPLDAIFTPSSGDYTGSAATTTAVTVAQAGTTTAVAVGPSSVTATVAPVAPGAGTPTGTVTFSVAGTAVGSAPLTNGVATLAYSVPTDGTQQVSAVYAGATDFAGSSASTARSNPTITATVSSERPKSSYGWYDSGVTVTFACTPSSTPLTAACPAPVTLTQDGAGQSVTRTITATDGGAATASVTGLNLDRTVPTVGVSGVGNGGTTFAGTAPACAATDALSGPASCTIKLTKVTHSGRGLDPTGYAYKVVATDRAGNTNVATGSYTSLGIYLAGATYRDGVFYMKDRHSYPVTVTDYASTPIFQYAVGHDATPSKNGPALTRTGNRTWAIALPINGAFAGRHDWNIAVVTGDGVQHVIHIHR